MRCIYVSTDPHHIYAHRITDTAVEVVVSRMGVNECVCKLRNWGSGCGLGG